MEKVETVFNSNEDDVKRFFKFHLSRKSSLRYILLAIGLVTVVVSLVIMFFYQVDYYILLLIGIAIITTTEASRNLLIKASVKKAPRAIHKTTFYENKIVNETNYKQTTYEWDTIKTAYETNDNIFVYVSKNSAFIINKFNLPYGDKDKLISLLKNKLGLKKYKKIKF